MIRLVLFDIDGTLIRSGGAGEHAFAQVCHAEFGIADGAARLHFAGRTDPSIVRDFFTQNTIEPSAENFRRFFERYVFHLDDQLRRLTGQVLPGVHAWIHDLTLLPQQPVHGLLTGNIRLGAQIKLTHYGLWEKFRLGAFGDDHEDRNQIAVIARERGRQLLERELDGSEILVIGDTPRDIDCARAIGAPCLAVATGNYSVSELKSAGATWAVTTLEEISAAEACG